MRRVRNKELLVFLAILFLAASCASFSKNAYRALGTSSVAYDVAMKTTADLYHQKVVGEDVKTKAIELGNIFWAAYNSAVDALVAYEKTRTADDKAKVETALNEANAAFVKFLDYVKPFMPKVEVK